MGTRGGVSFVSQGDKSVVGKVLNDDFYKQAYHKMFYPAGQPRADSVLTPGYGPPTGATGDVNLLSFPSGMLAAYHIKGAGQTILAPFNNASGGYFDAGLDQAAAEGVEYLLGGISTLHSPFAVTQGGNAPAAFNRLRFDTGTVANVAEAAVGFRRAEAFQANLDDYADLVCLNLQGGNVFVETILNGAATSSVDTGIDVADDEQVTFEVRLGPDGVPSFWVNNTRINVSYQSDAGDVWVPFRFWLQVTGGTAFRWYEDGVGRLWHERNDPKVIAKDIS